jgi:hypothetical protein
MKKIYTLALLLISMISANAQMSKSDVEGLMKSIKFEEIKDVYLIRSRQQVSTEGWYEKCEEFNPKTCIFSFSEKSLKIEGGTYTVLTPYDKIKIIFYKKNSYLTIELVD